MIIKEITVTVERLINLGNYENVKYAVSATAAVNEGPHLSDNDRHETYQELAEFCREKLRAECERLIPAKGSK